jgi:hypothetical protein
MARCESLEDRVTAVVLKVMRQLGLIDGKTYAA